MRTAKLKKTFRRKEEIISRLNVKNLERFDRAIEYLKKRKLLTGNHGGYMLIRESVPSDFPTQDKQTTSERLYGKPPA